MRRRREYPVFFRLCIHKTRYYENSCRATHYFIYFKRVASVICSSITKREDKMQIYRQLVSEYGQEKGLSIYRTVKSLL